jgi:ubiquinone biosynthesis protein
MATIGWIFLGPLAAAVVTMAAGRLLGAKRGWVALGFSGLLGFSFGVIAAGELTGWEWGTVAMVLVALVLGTVFTMAFALAIDLLAPVGSLARGEAAGLVTLRNPIEVARSWLRPFRRYRQVVHLARENGVVGRGIDPSTLPAGVRRTLEQAGGIFVKLGQVASTRTDVLPRAWCTELATLRSGAAPVTEALMRPHIARELGADPEAVFAEFDWTPIASASISQVYRARLHDGTAVVVKVQRPGLDDVMALDAAAVMQIAHLLERRTPLGLSVRPAELAAEFLDGVREELDFTVEAANSAELSAGLEHVAGVRLPRLYPEPSGRHLLIQELIDAPNVGELRAAGMSDDAARQLAQRLVAVFVPMVFGTGVFHADPHPGNILLESDGTIVLIDLGAVGRIGPGQRRAVLDMLAAAAAGQATLLRQALVRMTVVQRRVDVRELDAALDSFLASHMRSSQGITAAAFEDMAVIIARFGIRLPRWFGTLSRTLVTLEGTLTGLDPTFSLSEVAKAHADVGDVSAEGGWRQVLTREALVQLPRLRRVPESLDELLEQTVAGRLSAQVSLLADEHDEQVVTRLADRLVLAIISSAVGVGSVLLLGVRAGPTLGASVSINEVIGYFGLAASAVLALRLVAGIIRDGEL